MSSPAEPPATSATSAGPALRAAARRLPTGRLARRLHLPWGGLLGAVLGLYAGLTPSLLPRPWLFEGLIAGAGAVLGYGAGTLASRVARYALRREPPAPVKRWAWAALGVLGPLAALAALLRGLAWQDEVRALVGEPAGDAGSPLSLAVVALVGTVVLLALCRGIRRGTARLNRFLGRFVPRPVATVLGVALVAAAGYWAVTGLARDALIAVADRAYAPTNAGTPDGVVRPADAARTGGPGSLVPWETLGSEGRRFVGSGPTAAQLAAFSGRPARRPVRVYVGLDSAADARQRAALAVAELERTGAFDRAVLVVAGTTGTGWLEPQGVDSVEYLWNGDTAVAGIQYSYLPSWISILVDPQRAADAGRELFDAVRARWAELPAGRRPKLLAYGLSLGSFSIQSAFASAADVAARADGAVFVGNPGFTEPWATITRTRDAGSPQWQPVYREGATVRFAAQPSDLSRPAGPWEAPRVVYLQHASDPVVWWSGDLLLQRPDWLDEARGPDVTASVRWIPLVTFLQVTVDQFVGTAVPDGHGHNYATAMVGAWRAVAEPDGWTDADTVRLEQLIAAS